MCSFALLGPFDKNPAGIGRTWNCRNGSMRAWLTTGVIRLMYVPLWRAAISLCYLPTAKAYRTACWKRWLWDGAVITTDVPGCRDTVEDGINGYLVPAQDADALANAMNRCLMLNAPLAAMGDASRALAGTSV